MAGIAGSTRVGERCILGGDVTISGHLTIASDVIVSGGAQVTHSIAEPGVYGGAVPASEARQWRKNAARFAQLDDIARRLRRLEKLVGKGTGGDA
jgi:UDP-3-O-[3-hydroxymyristoyl] glucosamine N-acyltransferase